MSYIKEKIVILSGGLATRLRPATEKIPKSLLDISGKPFITRQLELLKNKGFQNIIICAGFLGERIKEFIKDGKEYELNIEYSFDGKTLLGTGGALKKASNLVSDTFFVLYGDSYLNVDYKLIIDSFKPLNFSGLMTVFKNKNKWDKSNVWFEDDKIIQYDKKDKNEKMHYIDYGLGILKKSVFERYFSGKSHFDLEEVYKTLIKNNELGGYEVFERFYEIGSLEGLNETRDYFNNK
ncbi:MAG TPA: sugar phosphate nucleotidyltransferase [Ignavibacteria bacterium]